MNPRTIALISAVLAFGRAGAQQAPAQPADVAPAAEAQGRRAPELVEEIVVEGKKRTRVDSLSVREVRETPAHDLGEALAQQGLSAAVRKGGAGTDVVVRGFQRDNLAVTIDGAKLHGACPNRMDPPAFHIDYAEVDQVELRKGPFDVGSPGGLGGTVDVRTRDPRAGPSGEVNVGYGRFGAVDLSATLGYGAPRAGFLLGGAYKTSEPFASGDGLRFTEIYPAASPNRYRAPAAPSEAYELRTGWMKVAGAPLAGHRAELAVAVQQADDVLYPYLKMDARADDAVRVNAAWETGAAGRFSRVRAQAFWNRVDHDMDDARRCSSWETVGDCATLLPRGWSMRSVAASSIAGATVEAALPWRGETVIGADVSRRSWSSETTRYQRGATPGYVAEASIPDVAVIDLGVRAEHAVELGSRVKLTAGLRLDVVRSEPGVDRSAEYARYDPAPPADLTADDRLLSGNVQADVRITAALSAFAGYGRGARVPDPQERYFALSPMGAASPGTVGRPALAPVRNDELDLGAKLALGPVLVKAQVFHGWLADYVTVAEAVQRADPTRRAKSWTNVDATMWGGEASARVALPLDLYARGSIAYTEGRNRTSGGWLAEIPPLRGALALRWDRTRWFGELETVLSADQHSVDRTVQEQPTGGWAIVNVKAGLQVAHAKVFAGVRNAFDRTYYESLSYLRDPFASGVRVPEPGRTFYVTVQTGF